MLESDASGNSGGPVQVVIRGRPRNSRVWRINHTGPANSTVRLYIGQVNDNQYRDGSSSGVADVAEYPNGLAWPAGSPLIWQWDTPGAAYVHIEYDWSPNG